MCPFNLFETGHSLLPGLRRTTTRRFRLVIRRSGEGRLDKDLEIHLDVRVGLSPMVWAISLSRPGWQLASPQCHRNSAANYLHHTETRNVECVELDRCWWLLLQMESSAICMGQARVSHEKNCSNEKKARTRLG